MKQAGAGAPSANRITLLRDADGDGVAETRTRVPRGPELAVRHGAGRQRPLRRRHRRAAALPVSATAQTRITARRHQGRRPAGRADQPPLDQERDRQPGRRAAVRRPSARTATSAENGIGGRGGPRRDLGDRPRDRRPPRCSPPACATRTAWPGSRRRGALWTAVNERDELGSDLVPDYMTVGARTAASTAGPTATTASTSTRASSRSGPTWSPRRSCPTTRWARTPPRWAWPSRDRRRRCRPALRAAARSSASTARGTASRRSGYKVIFVPFADGKPVRRRRSTC